MSLEEDPSKEETDIQKEEGEIDQTLEGGIAARLAASSTSAQTNPMITVNGTLVNADNALIDPNKITG